MTTSLASLDPAPIESSQWHVLKEQAGMLVKTGFLPKEITTPEKAVAIMLKGRELGIPPMYALSNIAVIQGKPAANAELMLALIYRDHGDDAVHFTEASATAATISYKRRHWKERHSFTFSIEDASRAGLNDGNWKKYPAAMLRARCISAVARLAFPDSIGGMYTPDELGAAVDGETGEVLSAEWPKPQPADPPRVRVSHPAPEPEPEHDGPMPPLPEEDAPWPDVPPPGQQDAPEPEPEELTAPGNRGPSGAYGAQPRDFVPATPKQIQTIERLAKKAGRSYKTDGMSRASASEIISELIGEVAR